jgi:hypothetical protein
MTGTGEKTVPVLDSSKELIGFGNTTKFCGAHQILFDYARVSPVEDWVKRNLCAISANKETLPFCPSLICPHDARVLGYPWALLPDGTNSIIGINGYAPVRATQWPPPETALWRDTLTNVTITAFDSSDRKLECVWNVYVPPLVEVGSISFPVHTDGQSVALVPSQLGGSGRIYKMTGRLNHQLSGAGSSVKGRLRKGSDRYTGSVHLTKNQTRGATVFPALDVRYSDFSVPDVQLEVRVRRVTKAATVIYKLYGQAEE